MKRLRGSIKHYPWGSTTAIPELMGLEPDDAPQAELWLGAHASSPSEIDGRSLVDQIKTNPVGLLGQSTVDAYGAALPYLLKVLAAERPLSLQAHPSRAQAESGFARENAAGIALDDPRRVYQDDWPKPELICALTDVEALSGFRDPRVTYAMLERLGVPEVLPLVEPLRHGGADGLRVVFEQLLLTAPDPNLMRSLVAVAESARTDPECGVLATTLLDLAAPFPGDPGVLAGLLLNRLILRPGQAMYLPAGHLHAYLRGVGVEIMATSDNVLRGGLTGKHVAVDELVDVLDFTPGTPAVVAAVQEGPGLWRYPTSPPEFALWRMEVGEQPCPLPSRDAGRILLLTEGEVLVRAATGGIDRSDHVLRRGEAGFAYAGESLEVHGRGRLFVAGPGL